MAYNTKPILVDVDGNPISQYFNPDTDSYEAVLGGSGANRVILYNADGSINNSLSLVPILDKLNQLTGTVIDEETRKSNEITRQSNEDVRISNEDIRNNNEISRVENEGVREENELSRQETISEFRVWEDYNNSKTYKPLNKVFFQGSSYICILESAGNAPTNETYWLMIAKKGQDGSGIGDMLKSVYDTNDNGIVDNAEKVNGFTVESNVPSDAKFTDTIIDVANNLEETEIGKALDASQGKALNDNKLNKSGDTLENYREKLTTLTGLTPDVDLSQSNVFKLTLEGATTLSISNPSIDVSHSFTLYLIQGATAYAMTFPANVKWMNGEIPDLSTPNKTYRLLFDTIDGGVTWHASFGGAF
ncbi:hypothetical protein CIW83_18480 [Tissierella sp. P1]|uniref:hypothetical protein n=1 Tax=Tissierella sp. P1 TaxID=1280483 RepID=UPI000B9FC5DD|nr:hypothetical protein [Tissierella sp. P1]OZV10805.1 hypothetical protein CIW83_18480 [Tissierella sp. P1]